jgi:hypothetical protein
MYTVANQSLSEAGAAVKLSLALVLSGARPRSQRPSPDTPARVGPTLSAIRYLLFVVAHLIEAGADVHPAKARPQPH